jgi:hypothetical protein
MILPASDYREAENPIVGTIKTFMKSVVSSLAWVRKTFCMGQLCESRGDPYALCVALLSG